MPPFYILIKCLFASLLKKRFDVVLLQETHHKSESEGESWPRRQNWFGPSFWSHGTSSSQGVAILVREGGLAQNPTCVHNSVDASAASLFSTLKRHTPASTFTRPVAVTLSSRSGFTQTSRIPCLSAHNCRVLVAGDFNCAASGQDCTSGSAASRLGGLQEVIAGHNPLDTWRRSTVSARASHTTVIAARPGLA